MSGDLESSSLDSMHAVATRLLLVTISAAVLAGCTSGGSGDKAGGNGGGSAPTVLTLAAGDADRRDVDEFVSAVTRLSHGSLRIGVQSGVHAKDVSYET